MPKTLTLLILAAGISYGGTLDYSLRWYEYGTPTPSDCNPTYGDLSLTVKCAGMPAATAQIRNSPFLLGIMNSYAPYGIGIGAYARYSSTRDFNSLHHADCHVPDGSPTILCGSIRGRMRG